MNLSQASDPGVQHQFITTCSGRILSLVDPETDSIDIEDVATGLANNCRFSGQLPVHYSVAAHSLVMADLMDSSEAQQYALLHDASEAYIIDLPRPVKALCPDYKEVEARIQGAIMDKFMPEGVSPKVLYQVHSMDKVMPAFEQVAIMGMDNVPSWVVEVLDSAYKGSSYEEELQRVIPMIKEVMLAAPFVRTRYLEYVLEAFDA